jgi:hypothetical protein
MTRPLQLSVLFALLIAVATLALAQDEVRVTGLYSNMKVGTEHISGVEIFIVLSEKDVYAIVQCAEAFPGKPFVAKATVDKNMVSFEVPKDRDVVCPSGRYQGSVSNRGLRGSFERTDWPGFLPRKKSFWQ